MNRLLRILAILCAIYSFCVYTPKPTLQDQLNQYETSPANSDLKEDSIYMGGTNKSPEENTMIYGKEIRIPGSFIENTKEELPIKKLVVGKNNDNNYEAYQDSDEESNTYDDSDVEEEMYKGNSGPKMLENEIDMDNYLLPVDSEINADNLVDEDDYDISFLDEDDDIETDMEPLDDFSELDNEDEQEEDLPEDYDSKSFMEEWEDDEGVFPRAKAYNGVSFFEDQDFNEESFLNLDEDGEVYHENENHGYGNDDDMSYVQEDTDEDQMDYGDEDDMNFMEEEMEFPDEDSYDDSDLDVDISDMEDGDFKSYF